MATSLRVTTPRVFVVGNTSVCLLARNARKPKLEPRLDLRIAGEVCLPIRQSVLLRADEVIE
jgi:hypothetical protein